MVAVGILRASGFLDWIAAGVGILTERIRIPGGVGSAGSGADVFFLCGQRAFSGFVSAVWDRFPDWDHCLHHDEQQ